MVLSFVLVVQNRSSLGSAAVLHVTWQSLGFSLLSSPVTHPDFLRKSLLLLPPLCCCDRPLKIYFTAGVNFQPLTLSLYPPHSGDCGLAEVLAENSQSQGGDVFK